MRIIILSLTNLVLALSSWSAQIVFDTEAIQHHSQQFDNIDWDHHRWIVPNSSRFNELDLEKRFHRLANHGFISRDGRNITIPMVLEAAHVVYNSPVNPVLNLALKLALLTTDAPDSFTLDDLKLSRSLGDNLHFNPTIFSTLSESSLDPDVYDTTSVGQVLEERLALAKKVNPNLINTVKERQSQLLEASLFLSAMGDPTTGVAPKKYPFYLIRLQ
ncbi:hypothetical protein GGU11DRAFT_743169 [Lentinula aff. detonsa]|nr:hypothetical protein GGU11DRAFT_743169 [Lentinula aff. detonsa]